MIDVLRNDKCNSAKEHLAIRRAGDILKKVSSGKCSAGGIKAAGVRGARRYTIPGVANF